MKVLHFTPSVHPENLGTSRRLTQLLLDDGNTHYFAAPAGDGAETGWEEYANFLVRRCRCRFRIGPEVPVFSRYLKAAVNSRRLARVSPPGSPDLVHGHSPLDFALAARRYAGGKKLPLVYEIHTLFVDEVAHRPRAAVPAALNRAAKALAKIREAGIIRHSGRVIVQTESLRERIVDLFSLSPELVRVIPNGIDGRDFDPAARKEDRRRLRREKGWEEKIVILYSGYLDRINGVDFLLRSAAGLAGGLKKRVRLILAGDGPLAESVRRRAAAEPDFLEYLGTVEPRGMPALYSAADVFVIPRPDTEAGQNLVPIKLLEAMAMEKVILASDLDALSEALGEGRYGVLFRREDPDDFREKLAAVVGRFDDFYPLGSRARAEVLTRFDWNRSRELLGELYRELAGGGDKP